MATQPEDLGQEAEQQVETEEGAATEQVQVPETGETDEPPEEQADPIADLAKSMGWRPKEQFKGDPNLWKPADEYIRAGGDIQRTQSRELKDLRTTMENVARTNAAIVQSTIAAEREKLIAKYNQAVEDGDGQAAFGISRDIQQLNGQAQQFVNPVQPPPAAATDWVQRNTWFNQDPLARDLALNVAERYAQAGKTAEEQLEAAEREVRRVYPNLFGGSSKPPPGVQSPSSRSGAGKKAGSTFADLPADAKKVAQGMAERGVIPDVEAYAKQYWQNANKRA